MHCLRVIQLIGCLLLFSHAFYSHGGALKLKFDIRTAYAGNNCFCCDNRSRFRVGCVWGVIWSYFLARYIVSQRHKPVIRWLLKFLITRSAALRLCKWAGTNWYFMSASSNEFAYQMNIHYLIYECPVPLLASFKMRRCSPTPIMLCVCVSTLNRNAVLAISSIVMV